MAITKITGASIAADSIDGTKIADDAINSEHLAADSIDAEHYAAGSVDATALGADAVTAAKIGDDVLNSEHYAATSIDNEHLADDAVGVAELSATGTASSSTFLRGDNSWATVTSVGGATGADFNDNVKLRFGAGIDGEIYSDGTNLIIKDGSSGGISIHSSALYLRNSAGTEYTSLHAEDGSVRLRYDNADKLETSATGITVTGAIAGATNLGKVLQVVEGTYSTNETTTSTSYVATNLDAVITPSSTSSKILVNITFPADFEGSVTHSGGDYAIYRDSTHILAMNGDSFYTNQSGGGNIGVNASLQKLDSPNSTSAITYKLYMRARNSNTTMKSCHNGGMGTVTLMEIGA
jgi:hypothetical protein